MKLKHILASVALYGVLIIGVIIFLFPFYFMFIGSFKESAEIFSTHFTFLPEKGFHLEKYTGLVDYVDFGRAVINSFIVASSFTLLALFFCSLGGFAFAKYNFPGRNGLFIFLLATMMIPVQAGVIASYLLMSWLHWLDTFYPLIIPGIANAFGIFLMRQYISSMPDELIDAAKIDGCSTFQIYYRIILPLVSGGLVVLGIVFFMGTWNDFFWPLIIIQSPEKFTVQLALARLNAVKGDTVDYGMIMAGATLCSLPLIIIFIIFHRRLVAGILSGAIK